MIQSIEQYLSQLKKELSGCDRATIQDALSDTEGHLSMALNSAMSEGNASKSDAMAKVIEKYGMPEEVAKAYRENESLVEPVLAWLMIPVSLFMVLVVPMVLLFRVL